MESSSCSGKWSLPVMLIVDLSLARVVQHSPLHFYALPQYTRVVSQIDGAVRAYAHAHDDHYLTRSKFNSLLTEMITPQTYIHTSIYIYIHIKPLPVPRVFGARSGSPRTTEENHEKRMEEQVQCPNSCHTPRQTGRKRLQFYRKCDRYPDIGT